MLFLLRFLRAVDPAPLWMSTVTVLLAVYGVVVVRMDPAGADSALAALLLWQMLSASRGFAVPAAAGHFDPILTRDKRWMIAVAHLAHSAGIVAVVWILIGVAEIWMGVRRPRALEPGRLAALAFVGAAAWSLSLGTARLVSGALWVATLVILAVTPLGLESYTTMTQRPGGLPQLLHALMLSMACPFLMIDVAIPMRAQVAAGLGIGALLMASLGVAFIVLRSYPLEPST